MFFNIVKDKVVKDLLHFVIVSTVDCQDVSKHIPRMVDSFVDSLLALDFPLIFKPGFSHCVVHEDIVVGSS